MSEPDTNRRFWLDGQPVPFSDGQTVMQAAQAAGHDIPHLCWHAQLGQSGSCRICTVDIGGRLAAACTTPAVADATVACQTPELTQRRRLLLQMLFLEGNHFCPSCEKSGHCRLQHEAYQAGMRGPEFEEFFPERRVDMSHPTLWLDLNRCILCKLCVRASHDVDGKDVFAIGGHGIGTRLLVHSPSGQLGDSDLAETDLAAQVCPVGAILPKRQGFAVPIGSRTFDAAPAPTAAAAGTPTPNAAPETQAAEPGRAKPLRIATVSLAGCFGCHTSLLDMDERILSLAPHIELDRSPLTDLKTVGDCDIGLVEGGLCNAENVEVLREFRKHCRVLVAVGACAVNGGLPAQRNGLPLQGLLQAVYGPHPGLDANARLPDDPELPLPLAKVHPIHEVVHVDHWLPGCPPPADAFWALLQDALADRTPAQDRTLVRYD